MTAGIKPSARINDEETSFAVNAFLVSILRCPSFFTFQSLSLIPDVLEDKFCESKLAGDLYKTSAKALLIVSWIGCS